MIPPHQFTTALPDLTDDLEPLTDSYDPLHFRLALYRSARVLFRLFGNLSPFEDPRYEAVLAASEDLEIIASRLPAELQITAERQDSPTSVACVRRFIQMTLAHRVYLIHRAYYIKSFQNATYAPSHTACIHAATDIITLAERGLPAPFYRLWNVTVWLVAAGIILSLDLVQAADAKREIPDATARRATLGNLVELLYNSGDVNVGIASRGAALIVHLGRAEQEIIAGSRQGTKMTREDILDLISRSEALPTPTMARRPLTGSILPQPDAGPSGLGGPSGSRSHLQGAQSAGKPFTPPPSHRSGSMHSQSLPAESPTVYNNVPPYPGMPMSGPGGPPFSGGGGMNMGPGPGSGMLQPAAQWGGMLDLGMGMGISPGLPAVGPVPGPAPSMGLGMGGAGYPMMNGMPMGQPMNAPPGAGPGMGGAGPYQQLPQGMMPDGTYPMAQQMPVNGEWIMPENNALMGFIDELFPAGDRR